MVVGGTGLYVDALVYDYEFSEEKRTRRRTDRGLFKLFAHWRKNRPKNFCVNGSLSGRINYLFRNCLRNTATGGEV